MSTDMISAYAARLEPKHAEICSYLRDAIDATLPKAASRIWRRMPVWFIGENPVVGYAAGLKGVTLLFWNGQCFDDPTLIAIGKFCAAQIRYKDVTDIDVVALRGWLKKSRTRVWDLVGTRNRLLAGRRDF